MCVLFILVVTPAAFFVSKIINAADTGHWIAAAWFAILCAAWYWGLHGVLDKEWW
jgi:hypothetical protein